MQNQEQKEMKLRQEQKLKKKFKKQNHFLKKNKIDKSEIAQIKKMKKTLQSIQQKCKESEGAATNCYIQIR